MNSGGEFHVGTIFWAVVEGKGEVDVDVCPKRIQYSLWFKVVEGKTASRTFVVTCCDSWKAALEEFGISSVIRLMMSAMG